MKEIDKAKYEELKRRNAEKQRKVIERETVNKDENT